MSMFVRTWATSHVYAPVVLYTSDTSICLSAQLKEMSRPFSNYGHHGQDAHFLHAGARSDRAVAGKPDLGLLTQAAGEADSPF